VTTGLEFMTGLAEMVGLIVVVGPVTFTEGPVFVLVLVFVKINRYGHRSLWLPTLKRLLQCQGV
jgi:hypothetical protein